MKQHLLNLSLNKICEIKSLGIVKGIDLICNQNGMASLGLFGVRQPIVPATANVSRLPLLVRLCWYQNPSRGCSDLR
jgi:hypothetical protein